MSVVRKCPLRTLYYIEVLSVARYPEIMPGFLIRILYETHLSLKKASVLKELSSIEDVRYRKVTVVRSRNILTGC